MKIERSKNLTAEYQMVSKSKKYSRLSLITAFGILVSGCSTMSNLPKMDNVKISRDDADKNCEFLGKLEGRTLSKTAKEEDLLKDLQNEAAQKGANFLVVKQFSTMGTSATGLAYKCP